MSTAIATGNIGYDETHVSTFYATALAPSPLEGRSETIREILEDPRLPEETRQKAIDIFTALEGLDITDIHTHYPYEVIVNNIPWENPTQVFLGRPGKYLAEGDTDYGFDHYIAQQMYEYGIDPDLVRGNNAKNLPEEKFEFERFKAMITTLAHKREGEVAGWVEIALHEVFKIDLEIKEENAQAIWDAVSDKINKEEFYPQKLLLNRENKELPNVVTALTTDDPSSPLPHVDQESNPNVTRLLPTWRPDSVLVLGEQGRYDFPKWLNRLKKQSSVDVTESIEKLQEGLEELMQKYKDAGCIAADLGIKNFVDKEATEEELKEIYSKAVAGEDLSEKQQAQWHSYMLRWLLQKNAEFGFKQFLHIGPDRDLNSVLFKESGPDSGGDAATEPINIKAMCNTFDVLNSIELEGSRTGTALAQTVVFPLSRGDYDRVLDAIKPFMGNKEGIRLLMQLGVPWWLNDNKQENRNFLMKLKERGMLKDFLGMLSDARSLIMVTPRMLEFRAVVAEFLASEFPHMSAEELIEEYGIPICRDNAEEFAKAA